LKKILKKSSLFGVLLLGACLFGPLAAGPTKAQELKLGPRKIDKKVNAKRATDALKGYYGALFKGAYEEAGSFVHPDSIEPVRSKLLELMHNAPAPKRKATLNNLGLPDIGTMQGLSSGAFFNHYVRSTYGAKLQDLANPRRKAEIEVKSVTCLDDRLACQIVFDLHQTLDNDLRVKGTNTVWVANVAGRWLVGEMPKAPEATAKPRR